MTWRGVISSSGSSLLTF